MKTKSILTAIVTLTLCAGAATAKGGKKGAGHGSKFDTDSDGKISLTEFTAKCKKPERAGKIFKKADTNNDGQLEKTEIAALKEKAGKKHKGNK